MSVAGLELDVIYSNEFPIHRSIDLTRLGVKIPVPEEALVRCSRLILSLLLRRNLRTCLERGIHTSGVTESLPFFSTLIWNALLYVGDWKTERENIDILLDYPVDCNYVGLCGFTLFHFYLLQALLFEDGFDKLTWWANHAFVEINVPIIIRQKKEICEMVLHPIEWIFGIAREKQSGDCEMEPRLNRILDYILSRGALSVFVPSTTLPSLQDIMENKDNKYPFLRRRLFSLFGNDWPSRWTSKNSFLLDKIRTHRLSIMNTNFLYMPSPLMNIIPESDPQHHLLFQSITTGMTFCFHVGYMGVILKTRVFPFTGESISREVIHAWMQEMRKKDNFMWLSEDYSLEDLFQPDFSMYHQDNSLYKDRGTMILQVLHDWISVFYPYTRIMTIASMPWEREKLMTYLCKEMNRGGYYNFVSFQSKNRGNTETYECFFLRAAMNSMVDAFLFSNRIEDLLARINLYIAMENKIRPDVFHEKYRRLRDFIESEDYVFFIPRIKLYQEEYDVTTLFIFYILRDLSSVLSSSSSLSLSI